MASFPVTPQGHNMLQRQITRSSHAVFAATG